MDTEINLTRPTKHPIKVAEYMRSGYPESAARRVVTDELIIDRLRREKEHSTNLTKYFQELAFTDSLTGFYSRNALDGQTKVEPHTEGLFSKILSEAKRHGHSLSAVMVDLDKLKEMNDTFGHAAGSDTLKKLAGLIQQNMRNSDFGFRYGGDEFLLLLTETDLPEANKLAVRIQEAISENASLFKKPVTVSMGISVLPRGDGTQEGLFAFVDAALYQAKKDGRNCIRTSEDLPPQQIPPKKI